jgi:hypothetical protein
LAFGAKVVRGFVATTTTPSSAGAAARKSFFCCSAIRHHPHNKQQTANSKQHRSILTISSTVPGSLPSSSIITMISSNLLQALLSPDGGIRSQAETAFHSLSLNDRVQGLLTELATSNNNNNNTTTKRIAAVLLRRDILKVTDSNMLQHMVAPLLQAFLQSTNNAVVDDSSSCNLNTLSVGHCLAEVCASLSLLGGNVETTLQTILSSIDTNQVAGLKLLAELADRAPMAFAKLAVPSLAEILTNSNWNSNLNDGNGTTTTTTTTPTTDTDTHKNTMMEAWTHVLVNAGIATTVTKVELVRTTPANLDDLRVDPHSPAAVLGTNAVQTHILPWMMRMLASCQHQHQHHQEDVVALLRSALQHLSEAAVACPSLLAATPALLESVTNVCLQLATTNTTTSTSTSNNDSNADIRLAALEVLTSLLSVGDVKRRVLPPALASTISNAALPICAQLLVEGTDDNVQDWATEPATLVDDALNGGGYDDDEQALFAESLMEALLHNLGAPALTVVLPLVEKLLESNDWIHAHAGLVILECALEATPVSVASHVGVIFNAAASLAASPNLRVQHRAVRLLGVLCSQNTTNGVLLVEPSSHHNVKILLERLAMALSNPCTKVSATASLSLVSFCRCSANQDTAESTIVPFLSDLLTALVRGPLSLTENDTGSVTTRVRAMGATACLAEAVGDAFVPFYPQIMPGLLATAQQPVLELAGAAVEAASIVGVAVGRDVFGADALQLLSWILPTLSTHPLEALLLACARIASVLEEEFCPYTNDVLQILLQQAQQPPDVSVMVRTDSLYTILYYTILYYTIHPAENILKLFCLAHHPVSYHLLLLYYVSSGGRGRRILAGGGWR